MWYSCPAQDNVSASLKCIDCPTHSVALFTAERKTLNFLKHFCTPTYFNKVYFISNWRCISSQNIVCVAFVKNDFILLWFHCFQQLFYCDFIFFSSYNDYFLLLYSHVDFIFWITGVCFYYCYCYCDSVVLWLCFIRSVFVLIINVSIRTIRQVNRQDKIISENLLCIFIFIMSDHRCTDCAAAESNLQRSL